MEPTKPRDRNIYLRNVPEEAVRKFRSYATKHRMKLTGVFIKLIEESKLLDEDRDISG